MAGLGAELNCLQRNPACAWKNPVCSSEVHRNERNVENAKSTCCVKQSRSSFSRFKVIVNDQACLIAINRSSPISPCTGGAAMLKVASAPPFCLCALTKAG